jgi:hypothetical protein
MGSGVPSSITVNEGGTTDIDIEGLDDIGLTINVPDTIKTDATSTLKVPDPIRTEMRTTLEVPDPIVTHSSASLDVKPVVMDLCLTVKLADLPTQQIRRPYDRWFGLTLFGREVIGFHSRGESQIIIEDLPRGPAMVWGPTIGLREDGEGPHGLRIKLED